jgi:CubicO group peptidase (beta-lactamase class C family)
MGMSALDARVPPHLINDETRQRQAEFLRAPNRLKFALTQRLLPQVGVDFQYTDITPYLVGGSVQYATRMSMFDYATRYLFAPMDFRNAEWMHTDAAGINNASYGLRLRPIDMQKFGLLYLNEGCWRNRQLLSRDWVRQSFTPWIKSKQYYPKPDYGWFWWTRSRSGGWNELQANGWKGQRISIFPEKQIVVTMTGVIEDGSEDGTYERIISGFIIPSIEMKAVTQSKSTDDLKTALSNVLQTKNALSAPIEDRMIPSSKRKEASPAFKP